MEMEMEAAAAMVDLNTLSRRELQALCKLNGVRANMTNVAMVEALQSLPSVDGIDQVGTTLCLPTPGKSAMKSALRTAAAADQQQQGSPLPRGRRVSVKSPEAIRMDAEEGEDETKRDLFREIVRTPGVALRSTSRRARATPAPLPTPAAGTLRRSQRSTVRKATAPAEVDVSTTKRSTRKAAVPKVKIDFDQEEDDEAFSPEEDKVQQVEPKDAGVSSDENCDDPVEEEVTKLLEEGNSKADEPEQGEEGLTSDEKRDDPEEEEVADLPEEGNSKADEPEQGDEGAAIGEEQKLVNGENSAPLSAMEGSLILGALPKVAPEPAMKNVENASTEDSEVSGNLSPVLELADEINTSEDKEVVAIEVREEAVKADAVSYTVEDSGNSSPVLELADEINTSEDKEGVAIEVPEEAVKQDAVSSTVEDSVAPNNMVSAATTEKEVTVDDSAEEYDLVGENNEEADLIEQSSEVDDLDQEEDMLKADRTVDEESDETIESAIASKNMVPSNVTEKEVSADDLPQADLTDDERADEYDLGGESSEEADLTDMNFDSDKAEEQQHKMLGSGEETKEVEDNDSLTGEEDDFNGDLSSEFDDLGNFSDAETASDSSPMALEGIDAVAAAAAASCATNSVESVITEEITVSSEGDVVSQHIETTVESLDKVTITEEKKEECAKEKKQLKVGKEMSLRKLKSAYKESLIAAKERKKLTIATKEDSRMALAELDNNAEC